MNNDIFLDEFAHMFTVEFVRNGQYTVSPFPMKYLRENQCFIEKDAKFDEQRFPRVVNCTWIFYYFQSRD